MKKFSKFIACLSAFAICISTLSFSGGLSAHSTIDASNGFSDTQISASPVKPNIKIDRTHLYYNSVYGGDIVEVKIVLSGENVDNNYCNTGFRIMFPKDTSGYYYGDMLTVAENKDGNPDVKTGEAIEGLTSHVEWCTDKNGNRNGIYLSTEGDGNKGKTGVMYKIKFKLPNWIGGGEEFPINIEYQNGDCFTNYENDETGKLMQSYLFTKGIKNGEIQVGFMTVTTTEYYTTTSTTKSTYTNTPTTTYYTTTSTLTYPDYTTTTAEMTFTTSTTRDYTTTSTTRNNYTDITNTYYTTTIITTEEPVQTTTSTTKTTTAPVVTGTGYENWTMFEDTIVSIGDDKVTFAERGKTAVMNNGYNMDKIKNAGVGSKVAVEAIVSPSGSILNIISIEVLEKPDVPTGDANGDGEINVADAVIIMQTLSNPDEYKLTKQEQTNADVVNHGDGVTAMDALAIQLIGLNMVSTDDFPLTTEELQSLMN